MIVASGDSGHKATRGVLGVQQSWQPEPPIAAAFFYPWYPSHWAESGIQPYTNYTPSLGYYDSTDDATIREQISLAQRAHLDAMIVSWFGRGEVTDASFQHILSVSDGDDSTMRWAAYYEEEGYTDPSPAQIASDLDYLNANVFNSPSYLRMGGRPVLFAYGSGEEGCSMADRWDQARQQSGIQVYLVLKVFGGYSLCGNQPDSWHQYSPTAYFDNQSPYSISVSPGFWRIGAEPLLQRNTQYFETAVQWMIAINAPFQLITTWNEWAEGTGVEPSAEFGDAYIDILCRNLPGTTPCGAPPPAAPTLTPTPNPTATPTPTPAPTPLYTPTPAVTPPPGQISTPTPVPGSVWGDVDCNGTVDLYDLVAILRSLQAGAPRPVEDMCGGRADVDCDGVLGPRDALLLLLYLAGFGSAPNCGQTPVAQA